MALNVDQIEEALARDVRRSLHTPNVEVEQALSSGLEYLLQWNWHSHGHSKWRWFDGLIESTFKPNKPDRLDIRGLMAWGEQGTDTRSWVDLFSADLRLIEGRDALATFTLRFGREGMENGKVPCGELSELMKELKQPELWSWACIFNKGDVQA